MRGNKVRKSITKYPKKTEKYKSNNSKINCKHITSNMSSYRYIKTANGCYIKTNGLDFKCKVNLKSGLQCPHPGFDTLKGLNRHENYHAEHREPRKCTNCSYSHPRQDIVTGHMRRIHGMSLSEIKTARQQAKESVSVSSSVYKPVIVSSSPNKLVTKKAVKAKPSAQKI